MKTKELKEKVNYLKELKTKDLPNILKNVKVQQKDGYIVINGTDLERDLILKIRNYAPDTEPILVDQKTLIDAVKKIKDKEIQIKVTNDSINLKNENFAITIPKDDIGAKDYPVFGYDIELVEENSKRINRYLEVNEAEFIKTIKETIPFVSNDNNREAFKNIYIDPNKIVGTNGCYMSVSLLKVKSLNNPILLPVTSAKSIIKIFSNSETLSILKEDMGILKKNKGFLSFKDSLRNIKLRVVTRNVEDKEGNTQYPIEGVDKILDEKTLGNFRAKGLLQTLEAVPDFCSQERNSLKVKIDTSISNQMSMIIENKGVGFNQRISLPIDAQGNIIQHKNRYSQKLLITCLKGLENPLIEYQGFERNIKLKENNKIRVLMPMRYADEG